MMNLIKIFLIPLCFVVVNVFGQSAYDNSNYSAGNTAQQYKPRTDTYAPATDTLPIEFVDNTKSIGQASNKMSLRNDFPYVKAPLHQSKAMPYPTVKEEDIAYKIRIWNDIDTRQRANRFLMYTQNEFGTQNLINIIMDAIKSNKITAFSNEDDRFTTPLTASDAIAEFGGGLDTAARYDMEGNIVGYQVRRRAVDMDSVYTYRLKEDWFYDKNYGRMMVRIIGIAPVIPYKLSTGEILPGSEHPTFWLYYDDLRPFLSRYQTVHPARPGVKIQLDEALDKHIFEGKIVKSDYENPGEISWNVLMPNPEDQEAERERIKQVLQQYEVSMFPQAEEMTKEDIENQKKKKGVKTQRAKNLPLK